MEKKNIALDALMQRREKLQSLLQRQRQFKKTRSCSEENSDVIENSDTETPIKRPRMNREQMCPETPVKCVTKQLEPRTKRTNRSCSDENSDVIENSDIDTETPIKRPRTRSEHKTPIKISKICPETPIKCVTKQLETPMKRLSRYQILTNANNNDSIVFTTSTMSLPLSQHFYGSNQSTPVNSPFKIFPPIKNDEGAHRLLAETRVNTADMDQTNFPSLSTPDGNFKDNCRSLTVTKPESVAMVLTKPCTSNAPAYRLLHESELEHDIAVTNSSCLITTTATSKNTYLQHSETSQIAYANIVTEDTLCQPVISSLINDEETHHSLAETRFNNTDMVPTRSCSASLSLIQHSETASPITNANISTEDTLYHPVCVSPVINDEETHRSLAETRPNNADIVPTTSCAASFSILQHPETAPQVSDANISIEGTPCEPGEISREIDVVATTSSGAGLTKSQKRRQRRLAAALFKKSYMDFISDEEQQDFSAGSSDNWGCSESDLSTDDDSTTKSKKRKKHTKVIEINEENVKIKKKQKQVNLRKKNKNQKDMGQEYLTKKGKVIDAKSMKVNPCLPGKCKRDCYNITEEKRESIFSFYWNLDVQRRRDWLIRCARVIPIKRKRVDSNKRNITYEYYINENEGHRKVCQKFLLDTLDITQRHLLYTLSNGIDGMAKTEMRKRSIPGKYSESSKAYVCQFFEKLPACPSHYNRKKSKRMYLPQHFKNLTNLFRIYIEDCKINKEETVNEKIFRNIFHDQYDLGFHTPKKDKCALCTKAENFGNELTENDKEKLKIHLEEKEAAYSRFKAHQTLKDVDTVTCSFDLQKVLNTPFGESMLLYYSRKYAVFDFTVYESITQNVFCFTWGECDGKRGSIEIASCLYLYLKELDKKGVKNAILYCDSCTGQNKNKIVLSVLNYFLLNSNNLEIIQINYLLPGHTYMPVDSVHATIEAEVKKIIVWTPSQWASYFESARKKPKPYNVTVMEHTDFMNWQELATKTFTTETSKNIKFKDIRVATFKKKNLNQMEIKYSMKEGTTSQKVMLFEKLRKKGKGKGRGKGKKIEETNINSNNQALEYEQELKAINVLSMYTKRLPISACKYKDLQKLCLDGVIPKRFHREFLEMPYDGKTQDTLIETDEEDVDQSDNEDV